MQRLVHHYTSVPGGFTLVPTFGSRLPEPLRHRQTSRAGESYTLHNDQRHLWSASGGHQPLRKCCATTATLRNDAAVARHPGELDLNLREYMVVLEKPVGLTLAPDPRTGQVVVQDVRPDSPAHKCGLIQVGDVVKGCSAVFGDDMWPAVDIRRVRWAINSRLGDVRLVLERAVCRPHAAPTAWYCGGKAGVVTRERDGMQLPYSFNSNPTPDDPGSFLDLPGAGKSMMVAFHRNTVTQPPPSRRGPSAAAAHAAALQRLRRELVEARGMARLDLSSGMHPRPGGPDGFALPAAPPASNLPPRGGSAGGGKATGPGGAAAGGGGSTLARSSSSSSSLNGGGGGGGESGPPPPPPPVVDVVAPAPPSAASSSNSSSSGGGGGGGENNGGSGGVGAALRLGGAAPSNAAAAAAGGGGSTQSASSTKERRVVTFLPWLLVACGRLEHRHIATIASSRSLGALLELSLTRAAPQPQPQPPTQTQQPAKAAFAEGSSSSSGNGSNTTTAGVASASSASNGAASSSSNSTGSTGSRGGAGGGGGGSGGGGGLSAASGGYLVVRGSDLMQLASDVGRVSYQALLAAAVAASAGSGGAPPLLPSPPGEVPPPPPPGSAAATAAMINGTDASAADANGILAGTLAGSGSLIGSGSSGNANNGNGNVPTGGGAEGTPADTATVTVTNGGGGSGGGLGSSTMAFLNRSIFLNLRPNPPALAAAAKSFGGGPAGTTAAAAAPAPPPTFSALPTSRFDSARVRHLLNAAASLQRLTYRRGGRLHRARREQCAVMLHCDAGLEGEVAVLLAGWLHWYGRLPLQEAILAAETAIGATVDQGLLEAGTAALLQGARERCSRVVLTWKYGGLSAYVAGDVVASWGARVPMVRCRSPLGCKGDTHPGHFYLEVQGLRPGVYYYKYIVDGTWAVDSLSSKVLDSAGNWNNVLVVPEPPQVLTSREGLALARWQAARLAFEAKMGLQGPGTMRPT